MNKRLIGRKLYVRWNENMYVAIEKIPDGWKKIVEMETLGTEGLELCNVYENENGEKEEEILGTPAKNKSGYSIDFIFTDPYFWKTPGEVAEEERKNIEDEKNG